MIGEIPRHNVSLGLGLRVRRLTRGWRRWFWGGTIAGRIARVAATVMLAGCAAGLKAAQGGATNTLAVKDRDFPARTVTGAGPLPLTGVNIAGGEFYRPRRGSAPEYGRDYSYPTKAEIDYFAGQGMNIFRYPFLWETLQPELNRPLNRANLERLKASVRLATSRKLVVLLDPHNFARYYRTNIIGGPQVRPEDFADFWQRLAAEFKDDAYVWYGLVNEPHDLPVRQWFEAANAAIAAIRRTGAKQLILVPGNSWTGAHSWLSGGADSNARNILAVRDPLDYWAVEVHQYLDANSSGTTSAVVSPTIGSERLKGFVGWCREHKMRAVLGEFGAAVAANGQEAVDDMLRSMERDRDVWLGWTWWAAGARWGKYMFSVEPAADGTERPQMVWLRPHLHGAEMPTFSLTVRNGKGSGDFQAGTAVFVQAGSPPAGMVFKEWAGDAAWLEDARSARTTLTMPFRNVQLEAVFDKAP